MAEDKSTTTLNDGTIVKWTINPNENNNYQNKLDEALLAQDSAAADDKIDIFLIEADYALKVCGFRLHAGRTRRYRPDGRRPVPGSTRTPRTSPRPAAS